MKRFQSRFLAVLLTLVLVGSWTFTLSGCQAPPVTDQSVSDDKVIVTSFLPMYIFTANLLDGIDGVRIENMAAPEVGCLHDYQLLPSDLVTLDGSDLFIYNGAGMESFLEDIAARSGDLQMVEASSGINRILNDDGSENPHVWLSVPRAIQQVQNISAGLQQAFPDLAESIAANETAYCERLEVIHQAYSLELADIRIRDIITFHEAFPYLAEEYGLRIAAVIEREPGSEPSASELAETIDLIRDLSITALFAEPQYSPEVAEAIARETGARIYTLDPVVTGSLDPALYETRMLENLDVLKNALK